VYFKLSTEVKFLRILSSFTARKANKTWNPVLCKCNEISKQHRN